MANELDMWEEIIQLERLQETERAEFLLKCYRAKYIDCNLKRAEKLKEQFIKIYGSFKYY
jgi:hypothetical protein